MWHSYVWRIERGDMEYVCRAFLFSFAKYSAVEYRKLLDKYIQNASFSAFMLNNYFVESINGIPKFYDLAKKDILLPDIYWKSFITHLNTAPKGHWSSKDQLVVDFFTNNISEEE